MTANNAPDTSPDKHALRIFGIMMAAMLALVPGLLIPWIWGLRYALWPFLLALAFIVAGLLTPNVLKPVYRGWMRLAAVLGWINTRLLLGLVFFGLIAPVGLVLRLFKDPLQRRLQPEADSYRVPSPKTHKDDLGKPY